MKCRTCEAVVDRDAIYCPECGSPFYEAGWLDPYYFVRDRTIKPTLRLTNRGVYRLTPHALLCGDEELTSLRDTTSLAPDPAGSTEFLPARIPWEKPTSAATPVQFACLCKLGGGEVRLPLPPIRLVPSPEVKIRLAGKEVQPGISGATPLHVDFRPSRGYQLLVGVEIENDSLTHVESARLLTPANQLVWEEKPPPREEDYLSSVSESGSVSRQIRVGALTPETHQDLQQPETYTLQVQFFGVAEVAEALIQPRFLEVPKIQVLVRRPTDAGMAYLGSTAIMQHDVSGERIGLLESVAEEGLEEFSEEQKRILCSDSLVRDTLAQLGKRAIEWRVPKGVTRKKRVAIDYGFYVAEKGELARYDEVECRVLLHLGDDSRELKSFVLHREAPRCEVDIELPETTRCLKGRLEIQFVDLDESFHYDVIIRPFEGRPFEIPIGVDFGNTNSCVALSLPQRMGDGSLSIPPNTLAETILVPVGDFHLKREIPRIVPTRISYGDRTDYRIGWEAGAEAFTNFKRYVNQEEVRLPGTDLKAPPAKLAVEYISALLLRAQAYLEERGIENSQFHHLAYSLPTTFSESKRRKLREIYSAVRERLVGASASTDQLVQMDESMAAFLFERQYELEKVLDQYRGRPLLVLICDVGGGTTDSTLTLAYWPEGQNRIDQREIAAGGDGKLGGQEVTEKLAEQLLGESTPKAIEQAELIKTGAALEEPRYVAERIGISLDEPQASDERDELFKRGLDQALSVAMEHVNEWLRAEVGAVLVDVLDKAIPRVREQVHSVAESFPLLVLLAGNGSRLPGFPDLVRDVVGNWIKEAPEQRPLELDDVRLIAEPKSCVAKGAYLARGYMAEVKRPYEPHFSYWLQLGDPNMRPDPKVFRVITHEGRSCVEVIPEGTGRPSVKRLNRRKLGDLGGGRIFVFRREGVRMEPVDIHTHLREPESGQDLQVSIDESDRLTWAWV